LKVRFDSPKGPQNILNALLSTDFPDLKLVARGKVRDIYALGNDLLFVATDRISAFDHILGSGIPGKGEILTQLSLFWFEQLADLVPNHVLTADIAQFPAETRPYHADLKGRSILVKRATMFPVECVVRGYLSGSGWKDYLRDGAICGIPLPAGLRESDKFSEPIFTPATKSATGEHDENISFARMADIIGTEDANRLRELSFAIYQRAARHAEERGILLADTKFEFGVTVQGILLADEVLTPDSSRFWQKDHYLPGQAQPSYDKQFVRDYLEKIQWNKQAPAPSLPDDVIQGTLQRYSEAYALLTGKTLA
jgi:phosphoribosylaminoimidazole-succinocarboxamide synthase